MKRSQWLLLIMLFYLSGMSGLIYEIVWVRIFSLVFGNTNYAVTTVLSGFFSGIAFGSLVFGKHAEKIHRPLRTYGILEIGIGIFALTVPFLIKIVDGFYSSIFLAFGERKIFFIIFRFILSFLILFPPTFLMGATFPVLIKFTSILKEHFGKSVSILYASNTFGGVTGCFISSFFLIQHLGIYNTVYIGVIINLLVGFITLALSIKSKEHEKIALSYKEKITSIGKEWNQNNKYITIFLLVAFATGLLSISFQVVWSRLLVYILSSSIYSFSIMLTTFLLGIALGSFIANWIIAKRKELIGISGILLILAGIYGMLTIPLMVFLAKYDSVILQFFAVSSWSVYNICRFLQSAIVLFIPTLTMGIIFPMIASIYQKYNKSGSRVIGNIYFFNTVGAILGSIIAGFILIPILGCKWSIILLAVTYIFIGIIVVSFSAVNQIEKFIVFLIALMGLILLSPSLKGNPFIPLLNIREGGSKITYIKEGTTCTVTVHQYPSYKVLNVNRVNVAGTSFVLRTTQKLQAFLPLFIRKDPKIVCQIGFGSGETSSIVIRYETVERLDVVDISPEVFASASQFKDINHGLYDSPKIRKIVMDGKNYIHLTDQTYDLIMNDSIHPVECGNASLYTKEYFEDCKKRLKDGGIMSSWFPLFALDKKDFISLIATFNKVFPGCTLWVANNCVNRHGLLIGRKDGNEVRIDFNFLKSVFDKEWISKELGEIRIYTVYDLLDSFMLNGNAINELVKDADINTDFLPILEYRSPTSISMDNLLLAQNIRTLLSFRTNVFDNLINIDQFLLSEVKELLAKFMESTTWIYRGHINAILGNYKSVVINYLKAVEVNPYDNDGKKLIEELLIRESILSLKMSKQNINARELEELGIIDIELGKIEKASKVLENLLKLEPNNRIIMYWLFDLYQTMQDKQRQMKIIDRLIEVDKKNPEVFFQKGLFLGQQRNFIPSLYYFKKAIRLNKYEPKYYFYLGLAFEGLGDQTAPGKKQINYYTKALDCYEKVKELDKNKQYPVNDYLVSVKNKLMFYSEIIK